MFWYGMSIEIIVGWTVQFTFRPLARMLYCPQTPKSREVQNFEVAYLRNDSGWTYYIFILRKPYSVRYKL